MRVYRVLFSTMLLIALSGCGQTTVDNDSSNSNFLSADVSTHEAGILQKVYSDYSHDQSTVEIAYPQISRGTTDAAINHEVLKAIEAFAPSFYGADYEDLDLKMRYELYIYNNEMISIVFEGVGNKEGTAHPTNHFFAVTFDLATGHRVKLSDFLRLDSTLIEKLREQSRLGDDREEWLADIPDKELLKILQNSNTLFQGTYSFFSEEGLGISFEAPHALGDHLEYILPYSVLPELYI